MLTNQEIREEISKLSVDERIQLVMDIWDDIADEDKPGLTDEQKADLDERLREMEAGNTKFYTWEEVKARITDRFKK
jgi:putative addiction module component (TIGR02574 family)